MLILSKLLKETHPGQVLNNPASCIIFDSVPGGPDPISAIRAFTSPLPYFWLKVLAIGPLILLYIWVSFLAIFTGRSLPFTELRRELNSPSVLPWTDVHTPRVYIYSQADKIVAASAIESHIAAGRSIGLNVRSEEFQGSQHVAHAKKDPERYWSIIQRTWNEALATQSGS